MRVELNVPESVTEPRMWVKHQPVLAMALRPGSFELGLRRSEMIRLTYDAGEMSLVPRYFEKWFRTDDLHYLSVGISDAALTAAADGTSGEVELRRADLRAAALQFCAAHPVVASVIPGTKTPARVQENVALLHQEIPADFWAELKKEGILPDHAPVPSDSLNDPVAGRLYRPAR